MSKNSPLAAASIAALALAGCVPAGASQFVYILGNSVVQPDCSFNASENGPFRSRGTVDLVLAGQYSFAASVFNGMPETIKLQDRKINDPRIEANVVQIESGTIKYEYAEGFDDLAATASSHTAFVGLTLRPQAVGGLSLPLLHPDLALAFFDKLAERDPDNPAPSVQLVTKITLKGTMLDGTPFDTDEFIYPITVCKGCLLFFPTEAKLGAGNPNCRNEENPPTLNERCQLGQDKSVDCRICRELKPIAKRNECEPF